MTWTTYDWVMAVWLALVIGWLLGLATMPDGRRLYREAWRHQRDRLAKALQEFTGKNSQS